MNVLHRTKIFCLYWDTNPTGKVRPITGHENPEGELYSFFNLALDGVGAQRHAPTALPWGKVDVNPIIIIIIIIIIITKMIQ
jgi:hypothetical protein